MSEQEQKVTPATYTELIAEVGRLKAIESVAIEMMTAEDLSKEIFYTIGLSSEDDDSYLVARNSHYNAKKRLREILRIGKDGTL